MDKTTLKIFAKDLRKKLLFLADTQKKDEIDNIVYNSFFNLIINRFTESLNKPGLKNIFHENEKSIIQDNNLISFVEENLTNKDCETVEIIGWLYQYFISDKKDKIFESLKKNIKISTENIPIATQLFTPDWIVKFMVENSLGRLWLQINPDSKLKAKMNFYIESESVKDFISIKIPRCSHRGFPKFFGAGVYPGVNTNRGPFRGFIKNLPAKPEEIKIIDPCCGTGHILVFAFDLLVIIYEEHGYKKNEIPELIFKNNLFGVDIEDRVCQLARFALIFKALKYDPDFLEKNITPQILTITDIEISDHELKNFLFYSDKTNLFNNLKELIEVFKNARNFGSLLKPEHFQLLNDLKPEKLNSNSNLKSINEKILKIKKYSEFLSREYHCVITNPPYMGDKGMNSELSPFIKKNYPQTKTDLYACFIEKCIELTKDNGFTSLVTMQSWMFITSFSKFRESLLTNYKIITLANLENMVMDIAFGTSVFTLQKLPPEKSYGKYIRIKLSDLEKNKELSGLNKLFIYTSAQNEFFKIPGAPVAYWISNKIQEIFCKSIKLGEIANPRQGIATGDNDKFLRHWFEVNFEKIGFNFKSISEALNSPYKWFPYHKGGEYRRWYGNHTLVIPFDLENYQLLLNQGNHLPSKEYYFQTGIT